ncbi:DUF362 domain-containing protein [Candidatus Bathyarchaeota archaeon]|nr:DUF362 domain-containing protein [Candidatus Bathyarchaeota archaeon]
MGSPVSLVGAKADTGDLKSSVAKAFDLIEFKPEKKVKTVIIKPNLNYYWEASTGNTTDPRVVGALIDYLRAGYGEDLEIKIAEADATAMRTKHVFTMLGYDKLAEAKKVELFNLCSDVVKKEKVHVNGVDLDFDIPQSLVNADLFINVPTVKTLRVTKITCAMKNLFGCIAVVRKFKYHKNLSEAIVGINKILRPDVTLVDGLVGLGQYPVKLDLIMAGIDPFSVDWIVAQIIGYNPKTIKFLKLALHENLGDLSGISTCGENLNQFQKKIPKEKFPSRNLVWPIALRILKLYTKISGDVIPPFLEDT